MNLSKLGMLLVVFTLLGGCASKQAADQQASNQQQNGQAVEDFSDPRDPLETVNRAMWDFNYDILDEYLLRPATVAYVNVMPGFARTGLHNMALNLEEPSNTLNNLLQGKLDGTFTSLGRFLINSTIGLLGTIDVASEMGLTRKEEEFGEVLGKWGVDTGAYLMLPAMGPTDLRSGTGDIVDGAYFPLADLNFYTSFLRAGIKALEGRAALMEQEEMLNSSLDPYAFVKDAYFQNLKFKVTDGKGGDDLDAEADIDVDALLDDLEGLDDLD